VYSNVSFDTIIIMNFQQLIYLFVFALLCDRLSSIYSKGYLKYTNTRLGKIYLQMHYLFLVIGLCSSSFGAIQTIRLIIITIQKG